MKAIIMAGGEGTRLRPLTSKIPKPMAQVLGKPVLEHILLLLKKHGITEIGMTLQYLPETIQQYFQDGSKWGVQITYFIENSPLGTAGSVKNAESFLDDTFLVISGDALTDLDITSALTFHRQKKTVATLVLKEMEVPLEYGVVVTDKEGTITRFLEKPAWEEVFSDTVNTGIYFIEPKALALIPSNQKYEFSKDLFPQLLNTPEGMAGFITNDYWCDIGNIESYRSCINDILNGKVRLNFESSRQKPGIIIGENCNISPNATIRPPVFIGSRTTIEDGCVIEPYSVIGSDCIIQKNSFIRSSIIWDKCVICQDVKINESILCGLVMVSDGVRAESGSVIGSGVQIDAHAVIKSNIKIWPMKRISEGSIVETNLIYGQRTSRDFMQANIVSGLVNIEITPEYMTEIGSAFASALGNNPQILINVPQTPECLILKHALLSGIISTGAKVYYLDGMADTNAAKYMMQQMDLKGGITVRTDGKQVYVELHNKNGNPMGKDLDRSTRRILENKDFKRANREQIKAPVPILEATEYYLKDLVSTTCRKRLDYHIGIYAATREMRDTLLKISSSLGIKFTLFDDKEFLSQCVAKNQLDFGLMISPTGSFSLISDDGPVSDDIYFALVCLITLSGVKGGTVLVPQHISDLADRVAERCRGTIVRVKTDALADLLITTPTAEARLQYELCFDYIKVIVRLCEFLQINRTDLRAVINLLPSIHKVAMEASCPTSKKGYVMKRLVDEYDGVREFDVTEGIKVYYEKGWVLAIPDGTKGAFRIMAEGFTQEYANEIAGDLYTKINGYTLQGKEESRK